MTRFECFATFVIRRVKNIPRKARPAIGDKSDASELIKLMSFPIKQVRLTLCSYYKDKKQN